MAILFDWYENPQSSEQQGEENALHPRLRLNGNCLLYTSDAADEL